MDTNRQRHSSFLHPTYSDKTSASTVQKVVRVPSCLGKYSTGKHDFVSRHFQPTLRYHLTVDDHLFPHEETCDAKGTRGEWWTCCVSQQNDNKWAEEMGKREYKSQYSTKPKFSHGKRWTVRLSNDASSYWLGNFQKLELMIVQYFN